LKMGAHTTHMITHIKTALLSLGLLIPGVALLQNATAPNATGPSSSAPEYTSDNQLKFPEHYREWVYLTSGFDMSYTPPEKMAKMAGHHHMFDNVFVNPEAYKTFVQTGTWPDKTMLVLEARRAEDRGSINQAGNYQGTDVMGFEVHIKDEAHFPGKWAFVGFEDGKTGKVTPQSANCTSCHVEHGAVDNTFVQFYPTLLPIAKSKGTLAASYQKESATPTQNPVQK
jgi:Cytochrome P460